LPQHFVVKASMLAVLSKQAIQSQDVPHLPSKI
jgi:hypothetical protein